MKILSLFVRYGQEKYGDALDTLAAYYRQALPEVEPDMVIVDNALPAGCQEIAGTTAIIGGSNRYWEFSAWDEGLAYVGPKVLAYDFVHFVTSAYNQLYVAYIPKMNLQCLAAIRNRDAVLGHIDHYNDPVIFMGRASQCWIRSSFFFMRPETVLRLGSLVSLTAPGPLFSGDPAAPFAAHAPIDKTFRDNIINWLTRDGTGQGTEWHSRFVLNADTLRYFESKALAVLNEHALTLRLAQQGTAIVDATFLSYALRSNQSQNLQNLYDWRQQIKLRAPDL